MSSALTLEELQWVLRCIRDNHNHRNTYNKRDNHNNRYNQDNLNFPAALREAAIQKLERELVVKTEHHDGLTSLVSA